MAVVSRNADEKLHSVKLTFCVKCIIAVLFRLDPTRNSYTSIGKAQQTQETSEETKSAEVADQHCITAHFTVNDEQLLAVQRPVEPIHSARRKFRQSMRLRSMVAL